MDEARSLVLFEFSPVGLLQTSLDGRILAANEAAHRMLDYPPGGLVGLSLGQLAGLSGAAFEEAHGRRMADLRSEGRLDFLTRLRTRSGALRLVHVLTRLLPTEGGAPALLSTWTDVTEERRRQEALEESERWLKASQRVARIGHFVFSLAEDRWRSSEALDELFGIDATYPRNALGWLELVRADQQPAMGAYLQALLASKGRFDREYPIRNVRTGEERWVHGLGELELDAKGTPVSLFGTIQDVTERHVADAERTRTEARYRLVAEHAEDVIWRLDLESHRCTYVSPSIQRLRGLTIQEALAEPLASAFLPESLTRLDAALARLQEAGAGAHTGLYDQPCRDGSVKHVEIRASLQLDPTGRPVGVVGVSRDATARVAAERSLRRLAAAVDQAPVSIVITDTQGRIEYVNPAFERTTGWLAAEAIGQNPRLLKSDRHDQAFYRQLWETIVGGGTWQGQLVNRARDGQLFTEVASISPVRDEAGIICHFVAVKRDVTEELRLAEQLTQAQKMESIGRLAGGVAHDFNNLLTVILTSTSILSDGLRRGAVDLDEDVEQIHGAALRARELTRQLLTFARKQPRRQERIDLGQVLRGSEKLLHRVLGEDVVLEVRTADGLWPVLGDVGQVEQVAMNLAVNARDAMPGGGRIQVELRNLVAGPEETRRFVGMPAGEYVLLGFQDDGQGMPAEVQAHIFEPFFTTKALGQGTGLGLSTVHGIVTQSEGFIRVESAPGQGTRFEIALPRARGEVAAGVAVVAAPRARGREVVLVVEDDAHVRAAAVRVLIDGGYRVLEAAGGEAALEQAERCPDRIDLTITDVVMPGLDGPGLSRLLRRARPGQRMLLISGHTGEFLARRGNLEAGQAFLQKPFTRDGLLEAVRAAIDAAPSGAGAGAQRT